MGKIFSNNISKKEPKYTKNSYNSTPKKKKNPNNLIKNGQRTLIDTIP